MKSLFASVAVLAFSLLSGCSTPGDPHATPVVSPEQDGVETQLVYAYSGFNREGIRIVRGELTVFVGQAGRVTGRWHLRALVDTGRIGPQHGSGALAGGLNNGTLTLNLNPRSVDNNVILTGRFDRMSYAGRWEWIGFPGVINHGTFRAVRIGVLDAVGAVTD
jgi:hypothetical protein